MVTDTTRYHTATRNYLRPVCHNLVNDSANCTCCPSGGFYELAIAKGIQNIAQVLLAAGVSKSQFVSPRSIVSLLCDSS